MHFDQLKTVAFNMVAATMGYDAVWFPNGIESEGILAKVLYNDHAESESVSSHDYDYARPTIEYKSGDWLTLKQLVDEKTTQIVAIRGTYYYILKVTGEKSAAHDGSVYIAVLEKANEL